MTNLIKEEKFSEDFALQIKLKSDKLMNYFLAGFFLIGLLLAFFYDTWLIAIGVGGLSIVAYYSAKLVLPSSDLYQYVLSIVLGIFMAQYIYQMHGLFEMHFFAFIGSAILITYQNWKLQIPIALLVVVHHATFGYLQFIGYDKIYFTQLEYMNLQTFILHGILATIVFLLSGLWAYNFKGFTNSNSKQSFEIGKLQEADRQKELILEERKAAADAIIRSEVRFRSLIENSSNLLLLTNQKGMVEYASPAMQQLCGYTQNEKGNRSIITSIHSEDEKIAKEQLAEALQKPNVPIVSSIRKQQQDGNYIWMESTVTNMLAIEGVNAIVINYHDLTERKKAEQAQALEIIIKNMETKNKELEQFTYIASHDLQEPLRTVSNFAGILSSEYVEALDDMGKKSLSFIVDATDRMRNLISALLDFSRIGKNAQLKEVDCNILVQEVCNDLDSLIKQNNAVITIEPLPKIKGYETELRLLFQNLIGNSIKYRKSDISPVIKISSLYEAEHHKFIVKDNGIGFDPKFKEKIFILFQRLHTPKEYSGTGIGLAHCKKIIDLHNGEIWADSELGMGSSFFFTIKS
ncbi:MAG: hypothetical protein RJA07_924 [Bacteroidota bacterium]|jgi:PAS domain S-box-containing protein